MEYCQQKMLALPHRVEEAEPQVRKRSRRHQWLNAEEQKHRRMLLWLL